MSERYGNYIVVYNENQMEKAPEGYWICQHDNGKIFVLDNERFKSSFKAVIKKEERCKYTKEMF